MREFIEINSNDKKTLVCIDDIHSIIFKNKKTIIEYGPNDLFCQFNDIKGEQYDRIIKLLSDKNYIINKNQTSPNKLPELNVDNQTLPKVAKNLPDLDKCVLINESNNELL